MDFVNIVLKKTTIAAALGNMLEFYKFTLFSLFLPTLLPIFFPTDNYFSSLILVYLILAVGFLAYPFGSLIFGYIGDKYGRKIGWDRFSKLLEIHGKRSEIRKPREKKSVSRGKRKKA